MRLPSLPQERPSTLPRAYRRFHANPRHPGLHFKKVHRTRPVYSARINDDYRVSVKWMSNDIVWFWIGKHEEYERLLKQL